MRWWRFSLALAFAGCGPAAPVERVEWPVMGTVAAVQTRGPDAQASAAAVRRVVQADFRAIESLLNAHDPDAEIRRLARLPDAAVEAQCDAATRLCYAAAFRLMRATDGAFNPRWRGPGTLDLGAIAKGFAVDRASDAAERAGTAEALVDLGGNLKAVRGDWKVGVRDPDGGGVAAVVTLRAGEALATSAAYFRGRHIFDGRTARPVSNDVASVTVRCASAMWADGLSTTLFVLGPDDGRRFLRERLPQLAQPAFRVSALWILRDGRHVRFDTD